MTGDNSMIGTTISHYKILEKLGEGGMGVVYKAEDTKLKRTAALKFLPSHLSASEQDKARFMQEAQAAAALNHPNICTIYGIDEHEGTMFIAMEFVDGQTLTEKKEQISHKQAIDIGIQIADGLAAAHEKGIVHRDIKPENIMIRKDGIAQIMDFGLAKLRASGSKITRLTKEGSTIGTAGYMSPEQVQGQDTDQRSDIFSYGVLVYEMLTGVLPFKGVHETALAYEIVNVDAAPMSAIKPEIDPHLDAIVLECLEKDPRERTQSVAQVSLELKRHRRESSRQRMSRVTAVRPAMASIHAPGGFHTEQESSQRRKLAAWIISGILLLSTAFLGILLLRASSVDKVLLTASILPPEHVNFYLYGNSAGPVVISPDGRRLAFVGADSTGKRHLYLQLLTTMDIHRLEGTEGAVYPFWSPDNRFLGFFAQGKLRKIDVGGGAPVTICEGGFARGGSWNGDGTIIFSPAPSLPLVSVPAAGGIPEPVTKLDSLRKENSHRWPSFLPDGKNFLYLARTVTTAAQGEGGIICVGSLDRKTNKILVPAVSNPVFASGYVLYTRGTSLVAHKFDERSLEFVGEPNTIAERVTYDPSTNRSMFTVSSNGILVYQKGTAQLGSRFIFHDRSGKSLGIATELAEYYYPRLSPDGSRVSSYVWDFQSHNADIWIYDFARQLKTRFTFNAAAETHSVWSPDGKYIIFNSNMEGPLNLFQKSTGGAGGEEALLRTGSDKIPCDWSSDGRFLIFQSDGGLKTQADLWQLPLTGGRKPIPFLQTEYNETDARFSPDGRWVAYVSDESGTNEIYLRPFTAQVSDPANSVRSEKWQVSISGGDSPRWQRDGKVLYYFSRDHKMMEADIAVKAGSIEVSHVHPLFEVPSIIQQPMSDYDVTADGKRFLINVPFETQNETPLTLVMNWDLRIGKN